MGAENSNGYAFYYVERGDNLWNIAKKTFQLTSNGAIQTKVQEIVRRNGHLKHPDHIEVGQVLALGPSMGGVDNPPHAADLLEIEKELRIDPHQRRFILDEMPILQTIGSIDDPNEECRVPTSMNPYQLKAALPQSNAIRVTKPTFEFTGKDAFKILKATTKTAKEAAAGSIGNLLTRYPHAWQELEGSVIRNLEKNIKYVSRADGIPQLVPKGARAFADGGRVIILNGKNGGFYSYAKTVRLAKTVGKKLLEPAGKAFKIIDLGLYLDSMNEARGQPDQHRIQARETGKYLVGLAGSAAAPSIAGGVCLALTFTTGPGGVACFVGVFIATSYGASYIGEKAGEGTYDFVDYLYQNTLRLRASW